MSLSFKQNLLVLLAASVVLVSCYKEQPQITRDRVVGSSALRTFSSCEEMGDALRSNIATEVEVNLLQSSSWNRALAMDDVAESSTSSLTMKTHVAKFSGKRL